MKKQALLFFLSISISNIVSINGHSNNAPKVTQWMRTLDEIKRITTELNVENSPFKNLSPIFSASEFFFSQEKEKAFKTAQEFLKDNKKPVSGICAEDYLRLVKKVKALNDEYKKPLSWKEFLNGRDKKFELFVETLKSGVIEEIAQGLSGREAAIIEYCLTDPALIAQYQFNKRNADVIKQDPLLCVV